LCRPASPRVPSLLLCVLYSFECTVPRPDLHSFPTRRSSDLSAQPACQPFPFVPQEGRAFNGSVKQVECRPQAAQPDAHLVHAFGDRKSTRLNSSHVKISYAVFCLKKKRIRS